MKEKEQENMKNLAYQEKKYTYQDLLEMGNEKRYEIIDGELYLMSSPSTMHQLIAGEIHKQLSNYLEDRKCIPFVSPMDVCLSEDWEPEKIYNCVQPDIFVVCDRDKILAKFIKGAPDLIVEVLSDSTRKRDTIKKYNLYQKYGVKEYWMIDISTEVVYQYIMNKENIYTLPRTYEITEDIKVNILEDCTISLKKIIEKTK